MTNKTQDFSKRHIGLKDTDVEHILHDLGYQNVDTFFKELVPDSIFNLDNLDPVSYTHLTLPTKQPV